MSDIVQATHHASQLRAHVANLTYATDPPDKWFTTRLATIDTLIADLVGKRKEIEGR